MRIAFVSVSDQMGGSEAVLLEIMRGVVSTRSSWSADLIVPGEGPLAQAARACGANVHALPMPASLASFGETAALSRRRSTVPARLLRAALDVPAYQGRLDDVLCRVGPDVVHTNGFKAHVFASRSRIRRPLIWHVHEYVGRRPLTAALLRRYASRASAIVTNSRSVAEDVGRALGDPEVQTIPNGVDLARFSPEGPAADLDALCGMPPAPPGILRVGLVATFARWKGHEVFIEAMGQVDQLLPIRGYVVGGPVYDTRGSQYSVEELRNAALKDGVADRVGFTGFVDRPAGVLRALDVVVHASTDPEPFGMVIAEAMACGRPVITSGTGGAAELVRDGIDAVVCHGSDARALASCITALARDGAARERLGRAARTAAHERFEASVMIDRFTRLYEKAGETPAASA